jgi:cytochrome c2
MQKIAIIIPFYLATASALAQALPGDPIAGRALAERVCAECHRIEKGEHASKIALTPTFQDVANDRAITETSLRVFFQTPHVKMPNLILTEIETNDIMAYILSLK